MDRFIDVTRLDVAYDDFHLKSNMDRFIGRELDCIFRHSRI